MMTRRSRPARRTSRCQRMSELAGEAAVVADRQGQASHSLIINRSYR